MTSVNAELYHREHDRKNEEHARAVDNACPVCDFAPSDDCPRTECPRHDDNSCGRCGHTPLRCACFKPAEND